MTAGNKMTTGNKILSRRRSLLRRVALCLAILMGLLQGALFRDARQHPANADAQPAIMAALVDLCAPADEGVPAKQCHGSAETCCLAYEWGAVLPARERADLVTSLAFEGRVPLEGRRLRLARVASGWRSSWSAQAPPLFS
jgi:hypothetical protein